MQGYHLLRDHFKKYIWLYSIAILSMASANVIQSLLPKVLGLFADDWHDGILTKQLVHHYSLLLLAIGVGYCVIYGAGQYLNHHLGRFFEYRIRQKLFKHFSGLSETYFSKNGVGKLLSYVMSDVTTIRDSIAGGLNQLISATILSVSIIVMMIADRTPLSLIIVCVLPLLSLPFIVLHFNPLIRERSKIVQESLGHMTESAEEQFGGIRVTKTFAVEPIVRDRFGQTVDQIYESQVNLVKSSAFFQAALPLIGSMSLVIAIIYGGYLTIHNEISFGLFVALTVYLGMIVNPLQQIGSVINRMQRARASLDRINALLNERPDIVESEHPLPLSEANTSVDIRNLSFQYPDARQTSLHDVNLFVDSGQMIGIVGKTGSGKTTLIKLLLRVFDPPRGTVFIGGHDILDLSLESLRTQVAYVPQDGFLFSTTIHDNIAFYNRAVDTEKVEHAAKLSEFYANVIDFPKRFNTKLGERGMTLSGGQRQRASLARGLIKDAPILILDDSVSAVDAVTETNIIENLQKVRRGKTTILIAHRISAFRYADLILVLDEGRVIEQGTHEQLLKLGGTYASLHAIQEEGAIDG